MLTIHLSPEAQTAITNACRRAGARETGGMLFGEHLAEDVFRVVEATVAGTGTASSFVRNIFTSIGHLNRFFRRTRHDYRRFNYLGEWHSHPSFALSPSTADDRAMFEIVNDPGTGARFAVSLIVRLRGGVLQASAFAYFPGQERDETGVALFFE